MLELISTDDLINELVSRSTFAGVILCSREENKGQSHGNFRVISRYSEESTIALVQKAAAKLLENPSLDR